MTPKLLVFAYYEEASVFLKTFPSKQVFKLKNIQCLFSQDNNTYLLITGSGFYSVSVAVSIFFEKHSHLINHILCFNIGIAGSLNKKLYDIFYASKITNYHTLKSFYPDIFIKIPCAELISIEFPADEKIMQTYPESMFDMEGYSFVNAARFFVKNHQIHCIKFISDNDGQIHDMFKMLDEYEKRSSDILNIIHLIQDEIEKFFSVQKEDEVQNLQAITRKISEKLRLTHSQKQQLTQAIKFFLKNDNTSQLENILKNITQQEIQSKHQRNRIFEKLLKQLYQYV